MSNELKTGLTVVLAILVAYFGFRFMSDVPLFRQSHEIVTTYDRVDGLGSGGMIYMNGVRIGSVKNIELMSDQRVRVILAIEADVDIPDDSVARLTSKGILDGKAIVIERGSSDSMVAHGGEIEGVYVDTVMETLEQRGQELGDDVSTSVRELTAFLEQLNRTLDEEGGDAIKQTFMNVEETTQVLSQLLTSRQDELEQTITSMNRAMAQLDTLTTDSRPQVEQMLTNLNASSEEISRASKDLDQTVGQLNEILEKINNGQGTIGRMVNDPSLYENADSLSLEMRGLIQSIQENPGRYLRHMSLIEIF